MSTNDRRAVEHAPSSAHGRAPDRGPDRAPDRAGAQNSPDEARSAADRHEDMRTMIITVAVLGGALALAATAQAVIVLGVPAESVGESVPLGWDLGRRIFINLLTVTTTLLLVSRLRIETRRPGTAAALILAAAVGIAGLRALMQIVVGIYSQHNVLPALADAAVTGTMLGLIVAFAAFVTRGQQRVRHAERLSLLPTVRSSGALTALLRAQTRDRFALAAETREELTARFQRVIGELGEIASEAEGLVRLRLRSVQHELADVGQAGNRGFSLFTYPESLEHGLIPAVRAFIANVPSPIAVRLRISDPGEVIAATGTGTAGIERRAVLLKTVAEGIMNALEYCHAQRIDVTIGVAAGMVRISVTDDGIASETVGPPSGLDDLRREVSKIGGRLEAHASHDGGCEIIVFAPPIRDGA